MNGSAHTPRKPTRSDNLRITMKPSILTPAFFLLMAASLWAASDDSEPLVDYVDPLTGTMPGSKGSTFPGASVPFGMIQLAPLTGNGTNGYQPEHEWTRGFAFTRFSGTGGTPGLGNLVVTPLAGDPEGRVGAQVQQPFIKTSETAKPHKYGLTMEDGTVAELAAGNRVGTLRFTYPPDEPAHVVVDAGYKLSGRSTRSEITLLDDRRFEGWMHCNSIGGTRAGAEYKIFFHGAFDRPYETASLWQRPVDPKYTRKPGHPEGHTRVWHEGEVISAEPDRRSLESDWTGARFDFGRSSKPVQLTLAVSFVDAEGARRNFAAEAPTGFDALVAKARRAWNDYLAHWTVEGNTGERRKVFYTALYHTGIDPRNFVDADGRFYGMDHRIHRAEDYTYRTVFSGWDVYRSVFPLFTLIRNDVVVDQIHSLMHQGTHGGRGMPEWEFFSNYWNCMLGDPAVSVIADAYVKGIRGFDAERALELSLQNANGPESSRDEWKASKELGYVPGDISRTTENAYADYALARFAEAMGKEEIAREFDRRAGHWKNIHDPEAGWMRRKNAKGDWMDFGGYTDSRGVTESTTLQQSFFVPHDVDGLMAAMGGREAFLEKIDILFDRLPDKGGEYPYGKPWGNYKTARYTHDNEPVHFLPYMFNDAGAPWLTQKWTRYICRTAYGLGALGLVGNEDVGQMSAWYVLAASGLHPLAPGDGKWQITSPEFPEASFRLDAASAEGETFTVRSVNWSPGNVYIQSASLNGRPHERSYLTHDEILEGGELVLNMGPEPNRDWGSPE